MSPTYKNTFGSYISSNEDRQHLDLLGTWATYMCVVLQTSHFKCPILGRKGVLGLTSTTDMAKVFLIIVGKLLLIELSFGVN
ncbi:hypothetical protein QL285_034223 [Trifolium repens]|jgi:hypothetical protein|nr:hypothetical protein QL285_034223 [Trifolium repens]